MANGERFFPAEQYCPILEKDFSLLSKKKLNENFSPIKKVVSQMEKDI